LSNVGNPKVKSLYSGKLSFTNNHRRRLVKNIGEQTKILWGKGWQ